MKEFTRTPSGLVAKYLFFNIPVVWVEGRLDLPFYREILRGILCRVEVAGGKCECQALVQALLSEDLPYCVVIDGDYEILTNVRSPCSRLIRLRRYSAENYLCEPEAVEVVCRAFMEPDSFEMIAREFEELVAVVHRRLFNLVSLDAAHVLSGTGQRALPDAAEVLFETRRGYQLSEARISTLEKKAEVGLPKRKVSAMKKRIGRFCAKRRLIDVLRGKIAFGIMRRLVFLVIERGGRRVPQLDNESLRLLLISESWRRARGTTDHSFLKKKLRSVVRDTAKKLTIVDTFNGAG